MASGFSGGGFNQGLGTLTSDPTVCDGNTATGPDASSGSGGVPLTAIIDLGSILTLTGASFTIGWQNTPAVNFSISTNGSFWTNMSIGSFSSNGGTFALLTRTVSLSFSARYLRVSVLDTGGSSTRASIREISGSGVSSYVESPLVKQGVKPSSVDVLSVADVVIVKSGVKPSVIDVLMHSSGATDYSEPNLLVKSGVRPFVVDSASAAEVVMVLAGSLPFGTDVQRNNSIPFSFYDAPLVRSGSKVFGSDSAGYVETPLARAGLNPSAFDVNAFHDAVLTRSGVAVPGTSAQGYTEPNLLVKSGVVPSGIDVQSMLDSGSLKSGVKPSVVSVQASSDVGTLISGTKPSGIDVASALDTVSAKSGVSVGQSTDVFAGSDTGNMKSGVKPSGNDFQSMFDGGLVKAGAKALTSDGEARGFVEVVMVRSGVAVSGTDMATVLD